MELLEIIADIYRRSRHTDGVPRVYGAAATQPAIALRESRVARLMRANDLVGAHTSKKWRRGRPDAGGLADLLSRNFAANAPNQRWVADVTEFACGDGKLYLAGIRDLLPPWDRRLEHLGPAGFQPGGVGVDDGVGSHRSPRRVIHHADKGSICTSLDFAFAAGNADMTLSFGSTGDAFDNAAMETFWARLKVEIAWIRGSIWFDDSSRRARLPVRVHRGLLQPANATKPASATSPHPSTLTSGATTTDSQICHNPVSKKLGQDQSETTSTRSQLRVGGFPSRPHWKGSSAGISLARSICLVPCSPITTTNHASLRLLSRSPRHGSTSPSASAATTNRETGG